MDKEKDLQQEFDIIRKERDALLGIKTIRDYSIKEVNRKSSEATAFIVLSDFHCEETVKKSTVNDMNEYSLEIADYRINRVFQNAMAIFNALQKDIKITHIVLALLGDFISSNIHEELMENCSLRPIEAIMWVQDRLSAGIKYLLTNIPKEIDITVVCCSGNHSRITDKLHVSTASGNSLEFFMYNNLRDNLTDERLKWVVNDAYHTYLKVYKYVIRFHHGDGMRYLGGISGIFIPAYKAISQWNKIIRADLDIFAHFHQMKDGGNFLSNGSLIGFNAYALRIKADFEKPKQLFFLLDKKHGKTITTQIYM